MEEKQSEAQRQSNLPQITQQISNSYLVMLFVNLEPGESQVPQQYMQFFFLKEKKTSVAIFLVVHWQNTKLVQRFAQDSHCCVIRLGG